MIKIDEFPKISNKDNFEDLLLGLQLVMQDEYLPGLGYLNSAKGINPIVEKLLYGLQEKWITAGSKCKDHFKFAFPPFTFFSEFMCNQARTRNNPRFLFSHSGNTPTRKGKGRAKVSVRKTGIPVERSSGMEQDKYCPIHKNPIY